MKKNNNKIKNIWIFQSGETVHNDEGNPRKMRAINLTDKLNERGYRVVLWTTDFYHQKKKHRYGAYKVVKFREDLEIRFIHSPGYKKNISLKRLYDHFILGLNLRRILKKESTLPDIALIGYPPIETAFFFGRFLSKKNIPFIVDIKDIWPELFLDKFPKNLKLLARIVFAPYFYLSKKVISYSTGISAPTSSMLNFYIEKGYKQKSEINKVFRLTSEKLSEDPRKHSIEFWVERKINLNKPIILFVGSFMSVFNFQEIRKVAGLNPEIQFVLAGDGDYLHKVKKSFKGLDNAFFPGWIMEKELSAIFKFSTAFIAPYKKIDNFLMNIPNKIIDSFKFGCPLITPLSGEVGKMISEHNAGFVYEDYRDLNEIINRLANDQKLRAEISKNSSNLYNKFFEFNRIYSDFVDQIEWIYENWEKK